MEQSFSPRKITMRDCNLSKKDLELAAADGQKDVLLFVGMVTGSSEEPGRDGNNPYTVLTGDFQAKNLLTGDLYNARKAILPEVATTPILDLLAEGKKVKGAIVKVAVMVGVQFFQPRNPDGLKYKFTAAALIKPNKKSMVDEIMAELDVPALEDKSKKAKK